MGKCLIGGVTSYLSKHTKSIKLDLEFKSKAKEDDKDIKDHTKRSLKNVG